MTRTFARGGIHPHENKISAHAGIETLPLPASVALLLSQHLGAPAKPVVNRGDEVNTGQLIAQGDGFVSSNVHASVSGKQKHPLTYSSRMMFSEIRIPLFRILLRRCGARKSAARRERTSGAGCVV